ncbi:MULTISPECIES: HPr family phosphocarrier protein [Lachnoanaerobaculum]|jgi:phosphocarrier,  HPr family|uniref:HPr family phosphocarrier protein n=2 Tax=Lachnoanaerobaculum TaxID=1164882 RepID=A0A3P3Q181_9FIRM|nr:MULTISPECIES: HPr family phosphocarrier protein [Lachnoanaerobaculum]KXB59133.1 putative phosphocarrier protein HPr [Lachnoanaerobaculum saburreum]MBS6729762.1 HPr family phosphocarrier protein [Lachnospiraceae bacterium oral taxon 082]MDU5597437.1 HPr family phosphocarrier protein [Lachnospiraceae bacterium]RRJ14070.1 HPr family phosphocarrier protein [Lachnoanaerobaculum orale]
MVRKSVKVAMDAKTETRPVAMLVQVASQFESRIYVESGTKKVNAKSIMGMMTLKFGDGKEVYISADGDDEVSAVDEMERYLTSLAV